ncbi:hypothetical protein [Apocheima cinerarium nucleopolyhedrovirus]|uniref:hypothetical protein n=1 Tax=Apocheima cinerarium nucleopolyhedrovirus TaxID=307461 RepID=UPI0001D92046|nr:hypothetical protein [Apocheima cinerarium nucleopolyhedrovirus]ADB84378.1 hypothetical protein [Apocheima cinerarium nucleopolyhedrovirus]
MEEKLIYLQCHNVNENWQPETLLERFSICWFEPNRQKSMKAMITIRFICFLLSLTMIGTTFLTALHKGEYFLYYSNWALIVMAAMFATALINTIVAHKQRKSTNVYSLNCQSIGIIEEYKHLPWYIKLQWMLFNMAICVNLLTTMTFLFSMNVYLNSIKNLGNSVITINILSHTINSVLVIIELICAGIPVSFVFMFVPCVFNCVYAILYTTYKHVVGKKIYKFITSDQEIVLAVVLTIHMMLLYVVMYTIHYCKCKCRKIKY